MTHDISGRLHHKSRSSSSFRSHWVTGADGTTITRFDDRVGGGDLTEVGEDRVAGDAFVVPDGVGAALTRGCDEPPVTLTEIGTCTAPVWMANALLWRNSTL